MTSRMMPIHKIIENLKKRITNVPFGDPNFADPRYQRIKLSTKNFHPIKTSDSDRRVCYVDGGNVPIAGAPNFVVELVRLYFCKFRGRERIKSNSLPNRIDFYTVCCATAEGGRIKYETEFVPVKEEYTKFLPNVSDLRFDSFDETLMFGRQRASIDRVADAARLFTEWKFAMHAVGDELEKNDILVRDGTLQTVVTNEAKYANRTYSTAIRKGVIFAGLSKTSSLFTTTGYPLLSSISELAGSTILKNDSWYYHPIVKITHPDHRAEMFALKLHSVSEYVFRFEMLREQYQGMSSREVESVIETLAANSCDVCFPGYPYGLVEADNLARIKSHERESQEFQFMSASASAGIWDAFSRHLKCLDAHSLLNKLAGE